MDQQDLRSPLDGAAQVEDRPYEDTETPTRRGRRSGRSTRTWLDGSRTARAWNAEVLGWAAIFVGAGALGSLLIRQLMPTALGAILAMLALWVGFLAPVVIAFVRARPRGLLRFHPVDLLYGLVLGVALRIVQGWLAVAAGGSAAFPQYTTINGSLPDTWWVTDFANPVLISPALEELLFRGVVLVAVYRIARRGIDGAALAIVASTAAFVGVHALDGIPTWEEPVTLALVGITCALIVLLTGRIWGAILVHLTFNTAIVILALAGTLLA